ncbi:hypothetical protein RintRC_2647 [Richelia intracellularis]|nr:hypothetical protein RintRC_2647 [Richelia intracellularis]
MFGIFPIGCLTLAKYTSKTHPHNEIDKQPFRQVEKAFQRTY